MAEHQLPFAQITNFKFAIQPIPIPPDLRPMWKIAQILLVLKICSRSDKATLIKLQLYHLGIHACHAGDFKLFPNKSPEGQLF